VTEEKDGLSNQHRQFQAQIEALSSNQTLLRSNLSSLAEDVKKLTKSVKKLLIFFLFALNCFN
jgi:prefoldin subunit 5